MDLNTNFELKLVYFELIAPFDTLKPPLHSNAQQSTMIIMQSSSSAGLCCFFSNSQVYLSVHACGFKSFSLLKWSVYVTCAKHTTLSLAVCAWVPMPPTSHTLSVLVS